MTRLRRVSATARRAAARLLPAEHRDWAEALWAEAHEVPRGLPRLAWRAGGLRLIAREATMARRLAGAVLFGGAAAFAVWVAWPGAPASAATIAARVDVTVIVLLLTVLPLLAHRLWGPVTESRTVRVLRTGSYAAILSLTMAKASVERFQSAPAPAHRPQPASSWLVRPAAARAPGGGFPGWPLATQEGLVRPAGGHVGAAVTSPPPAIHYWTGEILFLLVIAGYVTVIMAVTARRSLVAPATLAVGTGAGIGLGAVMYAVAPLGLAKHATNPWLPGSAADPLVALAWLALLGGPLVAGFLAARRYRRLGGPMPPGDGWIRQSTVAGLLTTLVGALLVTFAGTGTIALMPRASWLMRWLYPGQHLAAAVAHGHELAAGGAAASYLLLLLAFPIIGLGAGAWGGLSTAEVPGGPGPGGGPPSPGPTPGPPDGGRSAGADDDDLRALRVLGPEEDRARDLVGATPGR